MANYKVLNGSMLSELISSASSSNLRRARINFHPSDDSNVQEMLICAYPDTLIGVHGHFGKSESFCVLMGQLDVFIFEVHRAKLIEQISLVSSSANCYYRLDGNNPHLVVPRSEPTVFFETTGGPFVRGSNSYSPTWAADFDVKTFLSELY